MKAETEKKRHESNKLKDTMVRTCIVRAGNVFARNGKIDRVSDFMGKVGGRVKEVGKMKTTVKRMLNVSGLFKTVK